jgi:hypothetical protein
MLHEFITANRTEIIARCRAKIAARAAPLPTEAELEHGVPLFLDQLVETLQKAISPNTAIVKSAGVHAGELLDHGFTISQVVYDYGGICQTLSELAIETEADITVTEFKTLNLCLDDAIAGAVTAYSRMRDRQGNEHLGALAHELRNQLNTAVLAFDMLKTGSVGIGGSTGGVLGRSLAGLRNLIDRELAEVRLGAGIHQREMIKMAEFIEDVEVAATLDADARGVQLSVTRVPSGLFVHADRQTLSSVVGNLLQNAFKFTSKGGRVSLHVGTKDDRVFISIEDQCGGLPPGKAEELFQPFEQRGPDRTGVGLGLAISRRGAEVNGGHVQVRNLPGHGCVFTVDLPRYTPS